MLYHILFLLFWVCQASASDPSNSDSSASYFEVPRIHFSGRFRADISTGNNYLTNYLVSKFSEDIELGWNANGSGEMWFVGCKVTSVVDRDGSKITSPDQDPIIGKPVVNNPDTPPAKLVDLDSPQYDMSSTIYGMRFGIDWDPNRPDDSSEGFIAEWVPSVLSRDYWSRQINDTWANLYVQTIATQGTSRLINVQFRRHESTVLQQLMDAYDKENALSVSVTVYNYSRPHEEDLFLSGNVIGTIGIASTKGPLNFVGKRVMKSVADPPVKLPDTNSCFNFTQWLSTAYFTNHLISDVKTVTIDFGNSVQLDFGGNICDFGPLYLAIADNLVRGDRVYVVGEIPYSDLSTSGVYDLDLPKDLYERADDHLFVVVWFEDVKPLFSSRQEHTICKPPSTSSCAHVILKEEKYHVRPMDHYIIRLESGESATLRMLVRSYGQPVESATVTIVNQSPGNASSPQVDPRDGMNYIDSLTTDSDGIATFTFTARDNVGAPRGMWNMDGVIYSFGYCTYDKEDDTKSFCETAWTDQLGFLVWGKTTYSEPLFWDYDIEPIFSQYERLYPAMLNILRLGNYSDVSKPYNVKLIQKAMSLDENHPSYMPVTRDLSPSRKAMILKWFKSDGLYRNWAHIDEVRFTSPDFCKETIILEPRPESELLMLQKEKAGVKILLGDEKTAHHFRDVSLAKKDKVLPSWKVRALNDNECSLETLKEDLQSAVTLEFSTIPLYLTSMYSIKPDHNTEVYNVIRGVVMQEMLHMAQAANILIALGGNPKIDSAEHAPSYPGNLPAGVLPGLTVTLQKASPKHIYDVFMHVEFPHDEWGDYPEMKNELTIGQFYQYITGCIKKLGDEVFCGGKTVEQCIAPQVQWPWKMIDPTSALYNVMNKTSALSAIEMIVEQGEGAGHQDPTYLSTDRLAHFYKFEELACKKHMHVIENSRYNFFGAEIEFTPEGVWPMRDNPSKNDIPKNTQAYRSARIFHRVYRSLLAKLQEVFNGNPGGIDDAMYLMESLQLHAKRLMRYELPTPEGWPVLTCGPVFDYDWPEDDAEE